VQINPEAPLWLDVEEFEALAAHAGIPSLQKAEVLYRGDFLDGFFDDWVINERYRLEALFLDLLSRLMVAHETADDLQAAMSAALRLLRHDPLREDAHCLVMRAHCRLGQRNAALEQYHRCRQSMMDELGIEPMAETKELYQAIIENRLVADPAAALHPLSEQPPVLLSTVGHNPLDVVTPSRLVGRRQELAFLNAAWEDAQAGTKPFVLTSGEAGIGKTRLIEEFANRLRWQGVRVLWGRCYEFERLLPHQPVAEALGAALLSMTADELEELPQWALAEAARLAPALLEKNPGLAVVPAIRSDQERARLFDGLARIVASLASPNTLLMVLEDLHWATGSTLQLIHYLARHLQGHPVLIVGTSRQHALTPPHPLGGLQQQLQHEGLATSLPLSPLSQEAVETLIAETSGAGKAVVPLARRLYQETEGNPFFLMEIVKALFETGNITLQNDVWRGDFKRISTGTLRLPDELNATVMKRIGRLSDDSQEALRLAAVLGREFDFDLLDAVWGRGEEAALEALDQLLRHRLVNEQGGAVERDYAFAHHVFREVVYETMPRIRRQRMHAMVGATMERLYGSQAETMAGELAFHFQHGRQSRKALAWLEKAGDQARTRYAVEEAVGYYAKAQALAREIQAGPAREADLLRRQAETHLLRGAFDAAKDELQQALISAQETEDMALQVQVLLDLADCTFHQDDFVATGDAARQAAALAQEIGDERSAGIALRFEGQSWYFPGHTAEGRERLEQACARLEATGDQVELGWAHLHLGALYQERLDDLEAALPHLEKAQRLFAATGCIHGGILISDLLGNRYLYSHHLEQAVAHYSHSLATAREIGYAAEEPGELARMAIGHTLLGDLATARRYAEECLQLSQEHGSPGWEIYGYYWLGHIAYEERKPQEALRMLSEALHICEGNADYEDYFSRWLQTQLSLVYRDLAGEENCLRALELARQVCAGHPQAELRGNRIRALSQQAMAHLALGDQEQALACSSAALALAESHPLTFFALEVPFNHAQVLKACGETDQYRRTLHQTNETLMAAANRIQNPRFRKSFLENIRIHHAIATEFEANQAF
jgi:predicted ATPase